MPKTPRTANEVSKTRRAVSNADGSEQYFTGIRAEDIGFMVGLFEEFSDEAIIEPRDPRYQVTDVNRAFKWYPTA